MNSAEWRQVWTDKVRRGESAASLSGRSQYTVSQSVDLVRDAFEGLDLREDDSLLDVGCAAGFSGLSLASLSRRYVGLDYSFGALRRAPMSKRVCANALSLPFRDKSFDKTHVGSVLLCLSYDEGEGALREIRRVTRHRAFVGGNLEVARDDGATHYSRLTLMARAIRAGWDHVEFRELSDSLPHRSTMFDMVIW